MARLNQRAARDFDQRRRRIEDRGSRIEDRSLIARFLHKPDDNRASRKRKSATKNEEGRRSRIENRIFNPRPSTLYLRSSIFVSTAGCDHSVTHIDSAGGDSAQRIGRRLEARRRSQKLHARTGKQAASQF